MFTPALKKIKEAYPTSSRIDALVMYKGVEDIYSRLEEINKIHFFDYLHSSKIDSLAFTLSLRNKYDVTINVYPANRKEYNIISFLIGAKKRAAINYLRKDFSNLGFLNNLRVYENDELHNVEENINLASKIISKKIASIPSLNFPIKMEEITFAENYLKDLAVTPDDLVIGFHPGCATLKNHTKRRWETDKFAKLGNFLIHDYNTKILIFGGPEELELKEAVSYKMNSPNVFTVDTNSLAKTASIMRHCKIFVTNDSSLMHVAASLRLNTVAIIGPTNTNYIHPWQTSYKIASLNLDCAPCFHYSPKPLTCSRTDTQFKCIKDLDVQMVYEKVKEFIAKS